MRYVTRTLLSVAVIAVAGCSLFRDSDVQVAAITSVVAPDTVRVCSAFHATATAYLGPTDGYVVERFEVSGSGAVLTVQAWSRFSPSVDRIEGPSYGIFGIGARPSELGEFYIIAIQPDKRETLKTITVLP